MHWPTDFSQFWPFFIDQYVLSRPPKDEADSKHPANISKSDAGYGGYTAR
ncbi:hypothetical protein C7450_101185 [Chelatococcus asaccharovorans]|uniref:Uncharacterized protein n=1 Tax=Chelatococcus asaccharovorans TaxID=28210 RepID=A0A2V3UI51_9HYPH|nr:hypothetical protein C7450_101185 [Chelatococcus asaccharovorans]